MGHAWHTHCHSLPQSCHSLACKAKTACLRLVDLQGSVHTHTHTRTLRIRIYLLSCIKYHHKHNVERVSTFAYRNAKVLVILQVTRVLEHPSVWTTSTNCHAPRQSQHRQGQTRTELQPGLPQQQLDFWFYVEVSHSHLLKLFSIFSIAWPARPPELLLLLCKSKCRGMSATMAIVQPCPANPHAYTHTHKDL